MTGYLKNRQTPVFNAHLRVGGSEIVQRFQNQAMINDIKNRRYYFVRNSIFIRYVRVEGWNSTSSIILKNNSIFNE